ncbi:restriction endonuclease subunit S [Cereibacter azotoformans]|uniref:restriction endonuclease subunit S n=1 Tax=Cereibacter azotoformans TaxID=43057 RepID=UPI001EEC66F6|nr:restriction endonuclease subunit S [Cereibacter azotoformans]ULB11824.1 restriction endonuclease subunit S [Cereibacter azotoformans]
MKLRHLAKIQNSNVDKVISEGEVPVRLCNYVDVYKNDFITETMDFTAGSATPAEIARFRVKVGDVIITKDSEDRHDIGIPAYVRGTADDLVCGYHLTMLRALEGRAHGAFLFWALQSKQAKEAFAIAANGVTRYGLTQEGIKGLSLWVPDLTTQKRIAAFLDHETARIDELIAKKEALMLGFGPRLEALVAAALQDDTLERVRFDHLVDRMIRRVTLSDHDELVRLGLYNRGRGIFKKPAADEEGMGDSDFFFVEDGDLILSGQFAWEGAVAQVGKDEAGCVVSHRYPVYRGKNVETSYFLAFLRSKYGDFILNDASRGSAGRNRPLNAWRLGKEKVPVPSKEIQMEIKKTVDAEAKLRAVHSKSIGRLKELRSALITAAVTGQIDVETYSKGGTGSAALDRIEEEMKA